MKNNRTISIDDEVWKRLEKLADKNFTSKSEMIQRLIIKETKTEKE